MWMYLRYTVFQIDQSFVLKGSIYLLISVVATIVDFGTMIFLIEMVNFYYLVAVTISFILGVMTKFWLNRATVFRERDQPWKHQMTKFVSVSITGLVLTNIIMFIGVDLLDSTYIIVKAVCIGIVFFLTLILHNYFSFSTNY